MAIEYTDADRQHFAQFVEQRALERPHECCGGLDCWVEFGPPALRRKDTSGEVYCAGCGGAPRMPWMRR